MQNMILPPECAASFDRKNILRLFNNADQRFVPVPAADSARIVLGKRKTDRTESDPVVYLVQGICQSDDVCRRAEQVKGKPAGAFFAYAGEFLQFTYKSCQRV